MSPAIKSNCAIVYSTEYKTTDKVRVLDVVKFLWQSETQCIEKIDEKLVLANMSIILIFL